MDYNRKLSKNSKRMKRKKKKNTSPLQIKQLTRSLTFPPRTDKGKNCPRGSVESIRSSSARKVTIP